MDQRGLEALCLRLPDGVGALLRALSRSDVENLEEIRAHPGRNTELVIGGQARETAVQVKMENWLAALSAHALYRFERQMAMGYIPLPGGHRAGVCGCMTHDADGTWRMTQVTSVCIRIGRHIPGASLPLRPYLLDKGGRARRVLVLGAPGSGKTTVLRDAALWLSQIGLRVAVADEREELFGCETGGYRLDVLGGMDKAQALPMLIRTMAPQVIITDELGRDEDAQAVLDALRCGVGLIVSAHAGSLKEAAGRPAIRELFLERAFDWCVLLGRRGHAEAVYDLREEGEGKPLGQLGYGGDGDGCRQRDGIRAL